MAHEQENWLCRTERLFGKAAVARLASCRVAVFGLGGVGGYAAEALARSGIGALDLIDNDTVHISNLNRQLYATHKTLGRYKADVAAERIAEINPAAEVRVRKLFYLPDQDAFFDFKQYDYIIDAVDTVTAKIGLAVQAAKAGVPILSCMGTGNKTNPAAFEVADIYDTSVCPLARVMRSELKRRGVPALKVVYSKEPPVRTNEGGEEDARVPASNAFVPAAAGFIMAGEAVKDLMGAEIARP